jgi:hypothetical protein
LAGRYLGRYLSSKLGAAADVIARDVHGIPVETALDPDAAGERPVLVDVSDRSKSRRNA